MDPLFYQKRIARASEQTEGLGLFASPPPDEPAPEQPPTSEAAAPVDRSSPAPAAPSSASSERGARAIDPHRKGQNRTIMLMLAALSPGGFLSREDLAERTGIKESSLCGRLDALRKFGWIERVADGCTAKSGLRVDGYRLTASGRAFVRERGAA